MYKEKILKAINCCENIKYIKQWKIEDTAQIIVDLLEIKELLDNKRIFGIINSSFCYEGLNQEEIVSITNSLVMLISNLEYD